MALRTLIVLRHGGTHLIKPILHAIVGKWQSGKGPFVLGREAVGPVVVAIRDPRNRLISAFRYKNVSRPADTVATDKALAKYIDTVKWNTGYKPIEFMHLWADRWLQEDYCITKFEKWCDPKTAYKNIARVCHFAGYDPSEAEIDHWYRTYYKLPGTGRGGYSGRHSQWQEWFGPRSLEAWQKYGGKALLKKMGYE